MLDLAMPLMGTRGPEMPNPSKLAAGRGLGTTARLNGDVTHSVRQIVSSGAYVNAAYGGANFTARMRVSEPLNDLHRSEG